MRISKRTWRILLAVYLVALFVLVVVKFHGDIQELTARVTNAAQNREMGQWRVNLMPFNTISSELAHLSTGGYIMQSALINLLGNIVPFIPLGFLLPLATSIKRYTFFTSLLHCFCIILFIEVFQLFTLLGSFDVDDIILNLCGCIIGYLLYKVGIKTTLVKENQA